MAFDHFFRKYINYELNNPERNNPQSSKYFSLTLIGDHKTFHGQLSGLGLTLNICSIEGETIRSVSFPYHLEPVGAGEKGGKETAKLIVKHVKKTLDGLGKDWFLF